MRIKADRPERQPEGLYYRLRRKMVTNAVWTGGGVDYLTATPIISPVRPAALSGKGPTSYPTTVRAGSGEPKRDDLNRSAG